MVNLQTKWFDLEVLKITSMGQMPFLRPEGNWLVMSQRREPNEAMRRVLFSLAIDSIFVVVSNEDGSLLEGLLSLKL